MPYIVVVFLLIALLHRVFSLLCLSTLPSPTVPLSSLRPLPFLRFNLASLLQRLNLRPLLTLTTDVTPKAITHRLSKIKAQAASFSHTSPGTPASARKRPSTPASASTKTPGSKKGKASKILGPNGNLLSATHTITTIMHDDGEDDEEEFDTPTRVKTEPGTSKYGTPSLKKRKVAAPKIEDYVGYAEDEGQDEGMGDAIDFSLGYPAVVKSEDDVEMQMQMQQGNNKDKGKGKQKPDIVDLTETADLAEHAGHKETSNGTAKGKGKAKEQADIGGRGIDIKVKKEAVDVEGMYEYEDDEMVV